MMRERRVPREPIRLNLGSKRLTARQVGPSREAAETVGAGPYFINTGTVAAPGTDGTGPGWPRLSQSAGSVRLMAGDAPGDWTLGPALRRTLPCPRHERAGFGPHRARCIFMQADLAVTV
jgi:hypothetical protein